MDTYYYTCDACFHVQPWPSHVDESPRECENCGNGSLSGPFDLGTAEEVSQVRIDSRDGIEPDERSQWAHQLP